MPSVFRSVSRCTWMFCSSTMAVVTVTATGCDFLEVTPAPDVTDASVSIGVQLTDRPNQFDDDNPLVRRAKNKGLREAGDLVGVVDTEVDAGDNLGEENDDAGAIDAGELDAGDAQDSGNNDADAGNDQNPVDPVDPVDAGDIVIDPVDPIDAGNPVDPPVTDLCSPGAPTLRRLNRIEYNNTVRDLTGLDFRPADDFPSDDVGFGFDNIGDVLVVAPLLVERYEAAATLLAEEILAREAPLRRATVEAETLTTRFGGPSPPFLNIFGNSGIIVDYDLPVRGTYLLKIHAAESPAGDEHAKMSVAFEGTEIALVDVDAVANAPKDFVIPIESGAGRRSFDINFTNDAFLLDEPPGRQDRNLLIDHIILEGPIQTDTSATPHILTCDVSEKEINSDAHNACIDEMITNIARKAYRRTPTSLEIARLRTFVDEAEDAGDVYEVGVTNALKAVLLSPHFLFRVEDDQEASVSVDDLGVRPVNDFELASRLSYFLWSSMPDDELLSLAEAGILHEPETLHTQIERMLNDEKSDNLVDNLAGQWLQTRALFDISPNADQFPQFNKEIRDDMRTEAKLLLADFIRQNRSALELLTADFTFATPRLAAFYGVPFVPLDNDEPAKGFRRISLANSERRGILTMGATLAGTSFPNRTSPVKRGKWVLEQLLCIEPPPPPPDVIGSFGQNITVGTMRQLLEEHRKNPECASCHELMDPIGFGLERFDAVGRFRLFDNGLSVDDSALLFGGDPFRGARQLSTLLAQQPDLPSCMVEKVMTFATGRGVTLDDPADACNVVTTLDAFAASGLGFADLIYSVVDSPAFLFRQTSL